MEFEASGMMSVGADQLASKSKLRVQYGFDGSVVTLSS